MINSSILRVLSILMFIAVYLFVPHFYHQRIAVGIYKIDFYFIWMFGSVCLIYSLLSNSITFKRTPIIYFVGGIYFIGLCIFNSDSDQNTVYACLTSVCCLGILFYLREISNSRYHHIPIVVILFGYIIQVYIGYSQAISNKWESLSISGSLYNSGFFGNYLAAMLPMLLSGCFKKSSLNIYFRFVFFTAFIVSMALLVATFARAAFIGSFLGCGIVLFHYLKKIRIKKRLIIILTSGCLLFLPLIMIGLYILKPSSALGRLTIYKVSFNILKEHPFTGVGPNRFSAVYNNYQASYFKNEKVPIPIQLIGDDTTEAFNSLLQVLVEYGLAGVILLVGFIFNLIHVLKKCNNLKRTNWSYIGSLGCVISILVCSLFSNPFHVTPILLLFVFHLSSVLPNPKKDIFISSRAKFISLLLCLVFSFFTLFYGWKNYVAESTWYIASESAKFDGFVKATKHYQKAFTTLKYNGGFLFNYGAEAFLGKDYALAIKLLERAKNYNSFSNLFLYLGDAYSAIHDYASAERNYLHAIFIAPSHTYPKYQLIQLYKVWGKPESVRAWTNHTLQFPVKVHSSSIDYLHKELKKLKN